MSQEITYGKIEEFLNGSLDNESQLALKAQLETDLELQKRLDLYKDVRAAQVDPDFDKFTTVLEEVSDQYSVNPPKSRLFKSNRWIAIAASVAAGLLLLVWLTQYLTKDTTYNEEQLYTQYAKHDISLQEMSSSFELGEIQALISNKEYVKSIPLIESYLIDHPDAADVQLAKGIALLETRNPSAALSTFIRLQEEHPIYQNEAKWYQALTYLKMNQPAKATEKLSSIPSNSSRFKEANELIEKLKN